MTFAFDKRKVRFKKIAGEIVLPAHLLITSAPQDPQEDTLSAGKQFRRTPYVAAFRSGWLDFSICTVHIYFGEASGDKLKQRIQEIDRIAGYLSTRADEALKRGEALILLGDFNIVHPEHETMAALEKSGFTVPNSLQLPSNVSKNKFYDQIAFKADEDLLSFVEGVGGDGRPNAGFVEFFKSVFRNTNVHFDQYRDAASKSENGKNLTQRDLRKYYRREWRTYQVSDHMPLWVRLQTNDSAGYLETLKT